MKENEGGENLEVKESIHGSEVAESTLKMNDSQPNKDSPNKVDVSEGEGSYINPLTPRNGSESEDGVVWKWVPRDASEDDLTYSGIADSLFPFSSEGNSESGMMECTVLNSTQTEVVKDLKGLKIRSNRGRPRKIVTGKENKYFKVPTKRKRRRQANANSGTRAFDRLNSGEVVDEAGDILETGLHMGLILVQDREFSLSLIKENLGL